MEKYNKEMEKLVIFLTNIINSNKFIMLVESIDEENTLEYGIVGGEMKTIKFNNLNGELFWEFVYKGICKVAPNAAVSFSILDGFGNIRPTANIDLTDNVCAIINNSNHKYDEFIYRLQEIMHNDSGKGSLRKKLINYVDRG